MGNIKDLIKNVASNNKNIETFAAKVIEINKEESLHNPEDAYSVNIMRADGAIIKNVRLKASIQDLEQGIITIPKKDSWVLASIIDGVETRAFISQFSEIERTFVRFKNEDDQYLEIDMNCDKFQMLFKEKENSTNNSTPGAQPSYKNIAQIEFLGIDQNISASFYDENGKEISKNSFNIEEQKISINEESTIFSLKDKEAKISIKDGFEALISNEKTTFKKGDLNFEMDDKFKINAGNKNLLTELENIITEISNIVVVQGVGPNVGKLLAIKSNLKNLLKT